jgi:hypothetical protein
MAWAFTDRRKPQGQRKTLNRRYSLFCPPADPGADSSDCILLAGIEKTEKVSEGFAFTHLLENLG